MLVPNVKTSFSTLSEERTERLVCIIVRANLEVGITSLMKRTLGACNCRLTVYEGGCATNDREGLLQILTFLLIMMEMAITGPGRGLPLVSLSLVMRITTISVNTRDCLAKAWKMTMSRALNQISKSPFTPRIKGGKLPW